MTALLAALALPAAGLAATTIGAGTGGPVGGWEFGGMYDSTVGQVVTVPSGVGALRSFTLWATEPPTLKFRGFVYAWDGAKATGPLLYESPDLHTTAGGAFQQFSLEANVTVTPGSQYVVFLSQAKDKAADEGISEGEAVGTVEGGFMEPPPYTEGGFVALANGFQPERWTSESWMNLSAFMDAYFSATFATSPTVTAVAPAVATAGDLVKVTGTELTGASEVRFGELSASVFTVDSETEITAEVPSGATGTVDVSVVTPAGTSAQSTADRLTISHAESAAPAPKEQPGLPTTTPARCVVPFLRGMSLADVKQALLAANCKLGKVAHHYFTMPLGELFEQNLHQGTIVPAGTAISIWLSRGAHERHRQKHRR
jgi:IPT/TIG domain/PASTA domain